jgi:hypothetical protein
VLRSARVFLHLQTGVSIMTLRKKKKKKKKNLMEKKKKKKKKNVSGENNI